jgi:hypothetical protein
MEKLISYEVIITGVSKSNFFSTLRVISTLQRHYFDPVNVLEHAGGVLLLPSPVYRTYD